MALFCYLSPIDGVFDPQGPISQAIPYVVIDEVNKELKKAKMEAKKQGQYLSLSAE